MKYKAFLGFALLASTAVHAIPITITQTFSNVSYNDFGVTDGLGFGTSPTGDWVFKGTFESDTANISQWGDIGAFQMTSLTLTQASLGLSEVGITNAPVLLFYPDYFGFTANIYGQAPFAVVNYEPNHFLNAHTLNEYLALITQPPAETNIYSGFGPQWTGFALEDGRRIYGSGSGLATVNVAAAVTVPEPSSLALMSISFLGLFTRRLRKAFA